MNSDFILTGNTQGKEILEFKGIPFQVSRKDGVMQAIPYFTQVEVNEACQAVFFLGMTTERPEGSEWWGQNERYYYHAARLFIGDDLGRINIIYSDNTMETIHVIFGVNAWNYDLFEEPMESEKGLNQYWGPYPEPFKSDKNAAALLDQSLVLMKNAAEKPARYILGIKVKSKPVKTVQWYKSGYKEAGFIVSAVTCLKTDAVIDSAWTVLDPDFFLRKEYFTAMDKLARRLYQYKDELPQTLAQDIPEGYTGPKVKFSGNGIADIFTNVYYHNIHDMAADKVDETGRPHTSSSHAPSFGCYVGFGTYKENANSYTTHMWSRDVGRTLLEIVKAGERERAEKGADVLNKYLYDRCIRYKVPHWKRIANASELGEDLLKSMAGKENDGHASSMLFIYNAYHHGTVDIAWLKNSRQQIFDAANWYIWQMDNPTESNFDKVLYSESEASTQQYGGYDLFSNIYAYYALEAYAILAKDMEDKELSEKCSQYAARLKSGIMQKFIGEHPRYGKIFVDTIDDCWTWEYKRFAPVFLLSDLYTYDPSQYEDAEIYEICKNTYLAQKEDYFSPAAGRQMGYGQGYLTETCIMLDEYEDLTACVEYAAMFSYHHADHNYIVPEGVIMHPSGRFWFRNCDLGNAVQQGEIIKCARLLIGLDDLNLEQGLHIIPRLPNGWDSIDVQDYKVTCLSGSTKKDIPVSMKYSRIVDGYALSFNAAEPIKINTVRFGPFKAETLDFTVDGAREYEVKSISDSRFVYLPICKLVDKLDIHVNARGL